MKSGSFSIYLGLLLSFVLIFSAIPALGYGESDEIPPNQPVVHEQQTVSTATTLYLPIVQSPKKSSPRVNVPHFDGDIKYSETAIFWFGKVTLTDNYADVRVGYNDTELYVNIAIFDRLLWYNTNPSPDNLTAWDATTLFINLNGDIGSSPGTTAYKFDSQLNWWEDRDGWQASYRGNGSGWNSTSTPFITTSGWRGNALNDNSDDRGWWMTYQIPFSSLGLSGPPKDGKIWGLAVTVHDRDDSGGTPISDKIWPTSQMDNQPETWGQLRFGLPKFVPPSITPVGLTTIRYKLNGAVVTDAEVGGHTICGYSSPTFFDDWGDANYNGNEQINIQDQSDVSDWPCFSKFYIDFPLSEPNPGNTVISANLRMYQFGGSDPSNAYPSLIQVMTVGSDWEEDTITWNNAPLAQENVGQSWAYPILQYQWPGVAIDWDVSRAVSEAIKNGGTHLRFVLYESDAAYHSGKYFNTSDVNDGDEIKRPTLTINWGN